MLISMISRVTKFGADWASVIKKKLSLGVAEDGIVIKGGSEQLPKHVAFIMDGNRRWALSRGLPMVDGYTARKSTLKEILHHCCTFGIQVVSIFAFSTENWTRAAEEVKYLMIFFEEFLRVDVEELNRDGIQVSIMGNRSLLPKSLQEAISAAEESTKANTGLQLIVALNYGSKYDIVEACRSIAEKVRDGIISPEDIDEAVFERELGTKYLKFPCVDLLIRTSGELRLSNFMLWQLAYAELYFVDKHFPDLGKNDLIEAFSCYQKRSRRYGGQHLKLLVQLLARPVVLVNQPTLIRITLTQNSSGSTSEIQLVTKSLIY